MSDYNSPCKLSPSLCLFSLSTPLPVTKCQQAMEKVTEKLAEKEVGHLLLPTTAGYEANVSQSVEKPELERTFGGLIITEIEVSITEKGLFLELEIQKGILLSESNPKFGVLSKILSEGQGKMNRKLGVERRWTKNKVCFCFVSFQAQFVQ